MLETLESIFYGGNKNANAGVYNPKCVRKRVNGSLRPQISLTGTPGGMAG